MWGKIKECGFPVLTVCLVIMLFFCIFWAGRGYEFSRIMNNTNTDNVTVEWAIERLARARETHRPPLERGEDIDHHIDCMESYDKIANLIIGMANGQAR